MTSLATLSLILLITIATALPSQQKALQVSREEEDVCFTGKAQSPVDIPAVNVKAKRSQGPRIMLSDGSLSFATNQFDFQLNCNAPDSCGSTTFDEKEYKFLQLHFHAPSEHTVDGVRYPLEAHFVHQAEDGSLAVVAVLFRLGRENDFVKSLFDELEAGTTDVNINYSDFVKRRKGYCSYGGSLTTPPCTEGVTFFVQQRLRRASKAQIEQFARVAGIVQGENSRSVQDLNGRTITCFTEDD